jgi:hypothetical protein
MNILELKPWIASSETQRLWSSSGHVFNPWIFKNGHAAQINNPGVFSFEIPGEVYLPNAEIYVLSPDMDTATAIPYCVMGTAEYGVWIMTDTNKKFRVIARNQILVDQKPQPIKFPLIIFVGERRETALSYAMHDDHLILKRKVQAADALADALESTGTESQAILDKLHAYRSIK